MASDHFSPAALLAHFDAIAEQLEPRLPPPPGETLEKLAGFFALLSAWNRRINLTGADDFETLATDHLPDAVGLSTVVAESARLVDVGSGGGLPALPLAILRPDLDITLVEPRAKRVAFLRTAIRDLGTGKLHVVAERAEDLSHGAFDAACSRATFAPPEWLGIGLGLVRVAGTVFVLHREPGELEPLPLGAVIRLVVPYTLPGRRKRMVTAVERST